MASRFRSALASILVAGFVAGSIDIGAASLINHVSAPIILRYIAAGLIGMRALGLGLSASLLGLLLQWGMSILIAALCVLLSQTRASLRPRWVALGLAYGVVTFFVMNYVVLPLSAIGHAARFTPIRFVENLVAMLMFGLIIAFCTRATAR